MDGKKEKGKLDDEHDHAVKKDLFEGRNGSSKIKKEGNAA
jgi:hypothetical protein